MTSEFGEDEKAEVETENEPPVVCVCVHGLPGAAPISKSRHWKSAAATPAGGLCVWHQVGGGWHELPEQTGVLAGHTIPQPPQLFGSPVVSTQAFVDVQYVGVLPEHVTPQFVPSHDAMPVPLAGPPHAEHDVAPHEAVLVLLEHVPLQSCEPLGHVH
jgi:hypothetical protein